MPELDLVLTLKVGDSFPSTKQWFKCAPRRCDVGERLAGCGFKGTVR
jgi:hypothetical protein